MKKTRLSDDEKEKLANEFWSDYANLGKYFRKHVANDEFEMEMIRKLYVIAYNNAIRDAVLVFPRECDVSVNDDIAAEIASLEKVL